MDFNTSVFARTFILWIFMWFQEDFIRLPNTFSWYRQVVLFSFKKKNEFTEMDLGCVVCYANIMFDSVAWIQTVIYDGDAYDVIKSVAEHKNNRLQNIKLNWWIRYLFISVFIIYWADESKQGVEFHSFRTLRMI